MKLCYPDVVIKKNLDIDLLNNRGSNTHLFKVIMYLLNNAAEAMPMGGKIIVSAENRYIDKPLKSNGVIKKGDYVILKVSDNGMGIAKNDIERIFEPFFTKKVLGSRSGTGLGMAVGHCKRP